MEDFCLDINWNDKKNLVDVAIPEGVEAIGTHGLGWCAALKTVRFPKSLERLEGGGDVFYHCYALEDIVVDSGNKWFFFQDGALYRRLFDKNGCQIGTELSFVTQPRALKGKSFEIPDFATEIGDSAFEASVFFESIRIPDSVVRIGAEAFCNCQKIASLVLPRSLIEIGSRAFRNCRCLESLEIPDSVQRIGDGALLDCKNLKHLRIHRRFRGRFVISSKCEVEWHI